MHAAFSVKLWVSLKNLGNHISPVTWGWAFHVVWVQYTLDVQVNLCLINLWVFLFLDFLFKIVLFGFSPLSEAYQFCYLVVSASLRPHGLRHARLPCPSPTPGACQTHGTI